MGKYSQEAAQANAKIDAAIAKLGTLQNGSTALENNLSNNSDFFSNLIKAKVKENDTDVNSLIAELKGLKDSINAKAKELDLAEEKNENQDNSGGSRADEKVASYIK